MKYTNCLSNGTPKVINLIKYISFYLLAVIVLYFFGPVNWKTRNTFITFFLIALYILALNMGNIRGRKNAKIIQSYGLGDVSLFRRYYVSIAAITLFTKIISLVRVVKLYGWKSLSDLLSTIFSGGFSDLYYADKLESSGSQMFGGTAFSLFATFASILITIFIPMTIILFKELNAFEKLVGVLTMVVIALSGIATGTTEGFFIIIVSCLVGFLCVSNKDKKRKKKSKKSILVIILAAFIVLVVFSSVMGDRTNNTTNFSLGENTINKNDNWLYNTVPQGLKNLLIWVDVYACQGLYGMSLATTLSWKPMFGAGASRWLCSEVDGVLGNVYERLYSVRIEDAGFLWGDRSKWHSAFTWFANDVSFLGVIIVMFAIGWLFSVAFKNAIETKNPISVGLVTLMLEMLLFLPMNNIALATSGRFVSFVFYLVVWVLHYNNVKFTVKSRQRYV